MIIKAPCSLNKCDTVGDCKMKINNKSVFKMKITNKSVFKMKNNHTSVFP
jgi:hypothetical protein